MNHWNISKLKSQIKLKEYNIRLSQDVNKSRELLDNLITSALNEWIIFNVRTEEEGYLGKNRQEECLTWVIKKVIEYSTPTIIDQISIGYPASNRDEYINSIKAIATLRIIEFTIKQNSKDMSDNKPNYLI